MYKKGANRVQTRDLLHTFRMLYHCTASVQTANTGYETLENLVSILLTFLFLSVYLAPDDGSTAPDPLPRRPHDVHHPDLDWHLTIAHPRIATGLGRLVCDMCRLTAARLRNIP